MENNEYPIGVFDSGVGGLTVARAIQARLPRESVTYFGDRARCPYGDKSPQEVLEYAIEISRFLMEQPVKCIVVACNTATAVALSYLQQMLTVPVMGVIEPGTRVAVGTGDVGQIGVIGTSVTIRSHAYEKAIHQLDSNRDVIEIACPAFVPLVEAGHFDGPLVDRVVRDSLKPLFDKNIDTLVLGCTHYPMLSGAIRKALGPGIRIISSAEATAMAVDHMLSTCHLQKHSDDGPIHRYFTTGDGSKMRLALANWFASPVAAGGVTHVTLPLSSKVAHAVVSH